MTSPDSEAAPPAYPVMFEVDRQLSDRNRVTTAFRLILSIPHLLLVGGAGLGFSAGWWSSGGVLGTAVGVMAVISWFGIVFVAAHPVGLWDFGALYLRWRSRRYHT